MQKKCLSLILSVVVYFNVWAQPDFAATLQQFTTYQQQTFSEKIFAHTDKSFYVAGETVWFKLYLVEGASCKPDALSKVAYVEIIDGANNPVLQAKIGMDAGLGDGSFLLPASLNSGSYLLRAYTAWMKNDAPDYFFQKPIVIVNALKRPDWKKLDKPAAYNVQFFPEGGNLVAGLQSIVAFKAVNQYGKGVACSGVVVSDKRDTVARFQTLRFGMGQFHFTPVAGAKYTALIQHENGSKTTTLLPETYTQGVVMTLSDLDTASIRITATAANLPDAALYLLIYKEGQQGHEVLKKFTDASRAEFVVAKARLAEGVSHFTLFNESGQPLCERLFFKRPTRELKIAVSADRPNYGTRQKATLTLNTNTASTQKHAANVSMAVVLIDSLQPAATVPLQAYLWLTSELNGFVEAPEYYFNLQNSDADAATENLLLTQGWRCFQWDALFNKSKPLITYLPEYEGHYITGTFVPNNAGAAPDSVTAFLTMPGNPFHFATYTAKKGKFQFAVENAYGGTEVIVQAADSSYRAEITNPFATQYAAVTLPAFLLPPQAQGLLQARSVYTQAQNVFFSAAQNQFQPSGQTDTTAFYGRADKVYALDAYTRFTTMEEVLREYVPEVRVRKSNNQFHYQVKNTPYQTFFEKDPLVLLDGVPVLNLNQLMAFDPLKIKSLEVVARKYFVNDMVAEGIVNFTTYNHDLADFPLPENTVAVNYEGLQLRREFYTPVYETIEQTESRLPDFRNVLSWMPTISIGDSGKAEVAFYTSDLPGTYAVIIQGITTDGFVGSAYYTFAVTK